VSAINPDDRDLEEAEPLSQGGITRRDFLKGAAIGAAAVAVGPALFPAISSAATKDEVTPKALTSAEFQVLTALVDRLLPEDEVGPGGVAARAHVYIDLALAGDYNAALPAYKANLAAVNAYAKEKYGSALASLPAATQDEVVTALEAGKVPGVTSLVGVDIPAVRDALFPEIQGTFFSVLLQHTREGMFGDPLYGGNRNFIGWNLIRYPGIVPVVPAKDQEIGTVVPLAHRSNVSFGGRPLPSIVPETQIKSS
jgi:gluconate 2-dehydrogenase gamma chain